MTPLRAAALALRDFALALLFVVACAGGYVACVTWWTG